MVVGIIVHAAETARSEISLPYGFELVEIEHVFAPELLIYPAMNNCGEVVFEHRGVDADGDGELILYDNCLKHQITHNTYRDFVPSINEDGWIAWTRILGPTYPEERIMLWNRHDAVEVAPGNQASINNRGNIAWTVLRHESCAFEASILYYDGESSGTIIDDGFSNQGVRLNSSNIVAWTSYHFCPTPWESQIKVHIDGSTVSLDTQLTQVQGVSLNDQGDILWGGVLNGNSNAIEAWEDGTTSLLFGGLSPEVNNRGDIGFTNRNSIIEWDDVWLFRDGQFYRLTENEPVTKAVLDINDYGELVISWITPFLEESGIRMLRRLRNGDVDMDGDVDSADFADFPACITGPGDFERLCDCRLFDMGHDRDVALRDFALF